MKKNMLSSAIWSSIGHRTLTIKYSPREEYGKQRGFQFDWLQCYAWLVYSKQDNGSYCLPCMLFDHGQDGGILVSRPMTSFTKAFSTTLPQHQNKESHCMAVTRQGDFMPVMGGKSKSITLSLDDTLAQRVYLNHQKLGAIVDTIILCGRQNIPLRGHRDSSTDV